MAFEREYYEKIGKGYEFTISRQRLMQEYFTLLSKKIKGINRILDVGCAYGYFLSICEKKHVPETFGIEVSNHALKIARSVTRAKLHNVDISNGDAPFPNDYFDAVTSFAVIEHLRENTKFLKEIQRILRKGGIFFLVTPNGGFALREMFLKNEDPTHINVHDAAHWGEELREAGFSDIEVNGCLMHGFPPFQNIRERFERYNLASHKLIFCSLLQLTQRLFIFAEK